MRMARVALAILLTACSSSSPDPEPEKTDAAVSPLQPSCAEQDATCAKVLSGSVSLPCHQNDPGRSLIQACESSSRPASDQTWLCCRNQ